MPQGTGLEDVNVQFLGFGRVKWHAQRHKRISEPLNADADGTTTEVRSTRFRDRVVVYIYDTIEVKGDVFGDGVEFIEIVFVVFDVGRQSEGARLHTAVSSGEEYSIISVQRLEDLIVPTFCWFDLASNDH